MGRILLLSFAFLILAACSTAKPRGQVVRLDAGVQKASPAQTQGKSSGPLFRQGRDTASLVPDQTEDAAVFHFSLGQAYSLDNDPERAIESYRATLVHDPGSALVRARLAAELVKLGTYTEAQALCEEAIRLDPAYVDSYLLLAGIQVAAKEYDAAITTYEKALKVEPQNRDALLYHGVTLAEVGRNKEGVAQLEKLVKLKDSSESSIDQSVAYYYLAKVYEQGGQKENALASFRQALQRRPGFAKAALAAADLLFAKRDEAGALKVLEEAFREERGAELAERLADFYLEKNNPKRAVIYLETLVEEDPANENMKLRLALTYWQLRWLDKSRFLLSGLYDRYPASSELAFYLGELEVERQNFAGALEYYKRINHDYPKYDQMVGRVVYLYREQKRNAEGEAFLQEALRKRPDAVAFYPLLASLYEDQNELEKAREALERGEGLFPRDESVLYYLGFLYDRLGRREQSLATMEKLLVVNPANANALNFVGYTLLEQGGKEDMARAAELLGRALALKPEDPFVLDSYGWLLYRQGKKREAMKYLERAVALKPGEGVMAEHLADVYAALNMPQKALVVYNQALQGDHSQEFVARVEAKRKNVQRVLADAEPTPQDRARRSGRVPTSE